MSVNSRDACGDVDEHLLWKVSEGSRRRHRLPGDERMAKELLVGVVEDNGSGTRARAQWPRDEPKSEWCGTMEPPMTKCPSNL